LQPVLITEKCLSEMWSVSKPPDSMGRDSATYTGSRARGRPSLWRSWDQNVRNRVGLTNQSKIWLDPKMLILHSKFYTSL
jgi:hypothetical protein